MTVWDPRWGLPQNQDWRYEGHYPIDYPVYDSVRGTWRYPLDYNGPRPPTGGLGPDDGHLEAGNSGGGSDVANYIFVCTRHGIATYEKDTAKWNSKARTWELGSGRSPHSFENREIERENFLVDPFTSGSVNRPIDDGRVYIIAPPTGWMYPGRYYRVWCDGTYVYAITRDWSMSNDGNPSNAVDGIHVFTVSGSGQLTRLFDSLHSDLHPQHMTGRRKDGIFIAGTLFRAGGSKGKLFRTELAPDISTKGIYNHPGGSAGVLHPAGIWADPDQKEATFIANADGRIYGFGNLETGARAGVTPPFTKNEELYNQIRILGGPDSMLPPISCIWGNEDFIVVGGMRQLHVFRRSGTGGRTLKIVAQNLYKMNPDPYVNPWAIWTGNDPYWYTADGTNGMGIFLIDSDGQIRPKNRIKGTERSQSAIGGAFEPISITGDEDFIYVGNSNTAINGAPYGPKFDGNQRAVLADPEHADSSRAAGLFVFAKYSDGGMELVAYSSTKGSTPDVSITGIWAGEVRVTSAHTPKPEIPQLPPTPEEPPKPELPEYGPDGDEFIPPSVSTDNPNTQSGLFINGDLQSLKNCFIDILPFNGASLYTTQELTYEILENDDGGNISVGTGEVTIGKCITNKNTNRHVATLAEDIDMGGGDGGSGPIGEVPEPIYGPDGNTESTQTDREWLKTVFLLKREDTPPISQNGIDVNVSHQPTRPGYVEIADVRDPQYGAARLQDWYNNGWLIEGGYWKEFVMGETRPEWDKDVVRGNHPYAKSTVIFTVDGGAFPLVMFTYRESSPAKRMVIGNVGAANLIRPAVVGAEYYAHGRNDIIPDPMPGDGVANEFEKDGRAFYFNSVQPTYWMEAKPHSSIFALQSPGNAQCSAARQRSNVMNLTVLDSGSAEDFNFSSGEFTIEMWVVPEKGKNQFRVAGEHDHNPTLKDYWKSQTPILNGSAFNTIISKTGGDKPRESAGVQGTFPTGQGWSLLYGTYPPEKNFNIAIAAAWCHIAANPHYHIRAHTAAEIAKFPTDCKAQQRLYFQYRASKAPGEGDFVENGCAEGPVGYSDLELYAPTVLVSPPDILSEGEWNHIVIQRSNSRSKGSIDMGVDWQAERNTKVARDRGAVESHGKGEYSYMEMFVNGKKVATNRMHPNTIVCQASASNISIGDCLWNRSFDTDYYDAGNVDEGDHINWVNLGLGIPDTTPWMPTYWGDIGPRAFEGHMDQFRITKGAARYGEDGGEIPVGSFPSYPDPGDIPIYLFSAPKTIATVATSDKLTVWPSYFMHMAQDRFSNIYYIEHSIEKYGEYFSLPFDPDEAITRTAGTGTNDSRKQEFTIGSTNLGLTYPAGSKIYFVGNADPAIQNNMVWQANVGTRFGEVYYAHNGHASYYIDTQNVNDWQNLFRSFYLFTHGEGTRGQWAHDSNLLGDSIEPWSASEAYTFNPGLHINLSGQWGYYRYGGYDHRQFDETWELKYLHPTSGQLPPLSALSGGH